MRDVRALARAALSVVQPEAEDPVPERLPAAIRGLARATEALAGYLQTSGDPAETRRLALEAARMASTLLEEHEDLARNLGVNALVDQIHSSAVDLIGGTGMDRPWTVRRPCKPWKRPPGAPRGSEHAWASRPLGAQLRELGRPGYRALIRPSACKGVGRRSSHAVP